MYFEVLYTRNGNVSSRFKPAYIERADELLRGGMKLPEVKRAFYGELSPYYAEDTLDKHWEAYMDYVLYREESSRKLLKFLLK